MKEVNDLSDWADSLLEGDGEDLKEFAPVLAAVGGALARGAAVNAVTDAFSDDEVEEGLGDVAKKVGGAIKSAGKKALDVIAPGDDELISQLRKSAGINTPHNKPSMAKSNDDKNVEESALQAYIGDKKYGKDGMDALRKAGRDGADEEEKGRIKDKFLKKESVEQGVAEGLDENFINTDAQAVVTEKETTTHKGGKVTHKDGVTRHKSGPGTYGGYDDSTHPDSPEEKHTEPRGGKTGHGTDKIEKFKFSEGQEDLEAMLRIINR